MGGMFKKFLSTKLNLHENETLYSFTCKLLSLIVASIEALHAFFDKQHFYKQHTLG